MSNNRPFYFIVMIEMLESGKDGVSGLLRLFVLIFDLLDIYIYEIQ